MALHGGVLVVVEPGAAQQPVVHREAQRLDQVQRCSRCWRPAGSRCRCWAGSPAARARCGTWRSQSLAAPACAPAPRHRHAPRRALQQRGARLRAAWRRWSSRRRPGRHAAPAATRAAAGSTTKAPRRLRRRCAERQLGLVRAVPAGAAATAHRRGTPRLRAERGAPAPRPGCSRARPGAAAPAAPAAASCGSGCAVAPRWRASSRCASGAASSTAAWNLKSAISRSQGNA